MDKNIYYITNTRIPTTRAHGIQIMNMCSSFVKVGAKLVLVVPKRINKIKVDPFEYYNLINNFFIMRFFTLDLFIFEKFLGGLVFRIQLLTFYFSCFLFFLFKSRKNIIYTRDVLGLYLKFLGFKVFYECHDIPSSKEEFFHSLLNKADGIIVISKGLRDYFLKKGYKASKILLAPDAVDMDKFNINITKEEARKKLKLPLNTDIVLYSGHLYIWKGVDVLAQAAKSINNAKIYFVGGSYNDINRFKNIYTEDINLGNIVLVDFQKQEVIPYWLKAADVLVLPNTAKEKISELYTSPLKLFEYMASKKPIIAAKIPSLQSILNEDNCIFFVPDNPDDLAKQVNILLNNKKLYQIKANNAYKKVGKYTWQNRSKQILNFVFS